MEPTHPVASPLDTPIAAALTSTTPHCGTWRKLALRGPPLNRLAARLQIGHLRGQKTLMDDDHWKARTPEELDRFELLWAGNLDPNYWHQREAEYQAWRTAQELVALEGLAGRPCESR